MHVRALTVAALATAAALLAMPTPRPSYVGPASFETDPLATVADVAEVAPVSKYAIVAMGDSLTQSGGYQARLSALLGSGWFIRNEGISGNTVAAMLARFASVTARGDVNYVIVWGGINDIARDVSAATIQDDLQAMFTAAQAAGVKVVSVNITPFKTSADWSAPRQAVADAVNAWLASGATGIDHRVDAFALFEDPAAADTLRASFDSGDGLHISAAAEIALADEIAARVGTFTATKAAGPHLRLGNEAPNTIYRAGVATLGTDAQFSILNNDDATALGLGSFVTKGGASIERAARVGGTLTAGAVAAPSVALTSSGGSAAMSGVATDVIGVPGSAPRLRFLSGNNSPFGVEWHNSGTYDASIRHVASTGTLTADVGRDAAWGGKFDITVDTSPTARFTKLQTTVYGGFTLSHASPDARLVATAVGSPHGLSFYENGNYDASLKHTPSTASWVFDHGRSASWGAKTIFKNDTVETLRLTKAMVTAAVPVKFPSFVVSELPAADGSNLGATAYATDLSDTTRGATAAGGGSGKHLVVSDGANWIVQ